MKNPWSNSLSAHSCICNFNSVFLTYMRPVLIMILYCFSDRTPASFSAQDRWFSFNNLVLTSFFDTKLLFPFNKTLSEKRLNYFSFSFYGSAHHWMSEHRIGFLLASHQAHGVSGWYGFHFMTGKIKPKADLSWNYTLVFIMGSLHFLRFLAVISGFYYFST